MYKKIEPGLRTTSNETSERYPDSFVLMCMDSMNPSVAAIERLQSAMDGEAERAGIFNDDDVLALCGEVRRELYEKQYASNG